MSIPAHLKSTWIKNADEHGLTEEYDIFYSEIEGLETEQLRQILPLIGISFGHHNADVIRDDMLSVMHEAKWNNFFAAYRKITGRTSRLEEDVS